MEKRMPVSSLMCFFMMTFWSGNTLDLWVKKQNIKSNLTCFFVVFFFFNVIIRKFKILHMWLALFLPGTSGWKTLTWELPEALSLGPCELPVVIPAAVPPGELSMTWSSCWDPPTCQQCLSSSLGLMTARGHAGLQTGSLLEQKSSRSSWDD